MKPKRDIGLLETIGVLVAVAALSSFAFVPKFRNVIVSEGSSHASGPGAVAQPGSGGVTPGKGSGGKVNATLPAEVAGLECAAGRNGGATDTGVTATTVKLGATVVDSGIGQAFLADVRYGMQAVVNDTNASGGICGRRLQLVLKDDGWEAQRGSLFLHNLIEGEHVFALSVVPSSEGLRAAGDYIASKRIPVVGTDGMLIGQYTNPMIWPVAASTITAMHVMAKQAYDTGARHFALVYDSNYRFGIEGAYAFNAAVKRLTGRNIDGYSNPLSNPRCNKRFCGVKAGQPSYQTEIEVVQSSCAADPACDFVAYLMEPETAETWMRGGGMQAGFTNGVAVRIAGPQPLFNRSFGVNCADRCHSMWVWSGFTPPVSPFDRDPNVAGFVDALRRTNAKADPANSFVEGGYLGMKLMVDAMRRAGPELTRERLIAALNATKLTTGLSQPLSWSQQSHFANQCVRAFSFQSRPSFAGWRQETPYICDPWAGQDIPADNGG